MPVSYFLQDFDLSVLIKLQSAQSLHDLAQILGYKPSALAFVIYKIPPSQKYNKFKIPKRNGGEREICAPTSQLKKLQRNLANVLYTCRDEIDNKNGQKSLSHGFRRNHSIVTNARPHKRRRYVLNIDLKDFFPTFNFGRVRGFFIHNNHFKLNEKIATIIAQIACFENVLPQGSPCSPIIADMIAHLLDVRLTQLAKKNQLTYSRYADDITFSTNKLEFPSLIAAPISVENPTWILGDGLVRTVQNAGFFINSNKTRMQFKMNRQLVTGLTVNRKVNIRPEYYRLARAMCHSLFKTGAYHRPVIETFIKGDENPSKQLVEALGPLNGILSHIHYVKDTVDDRDEQEKRKNPTAARQLYSQFLKYRYFVRLEQPLIVCEGKTDNIYLKYAIRSLAAFHPRLGSWDGPIFKSTTSFFSYANQAHRLLGLNGGTGDLLYFFTKQKYKKDIEGFKHRPLKHPVIILIDNDDGAKSIFSTIKENYKIQIDFSSADPFFYITENLYLVKTPERGQTGASCIEDCFEAILLATELDGKKFNQNTNIDPDKEYGKFVFAEKVVRPNVSTINFSGFSPLLQRLIAAIDDYSLKVV